MSPRVASVIASPDIRGDATVNDSERPSDEEMFDALCSERRLYVLRHLRESGGESSLGTLVDAVASMEYGKRPEEIDREERRRIYVSLYQTHLPKLGERGVVDWDGENTVTLLIEDFLPFEGGTDRAWWRYYLASSVCWGIVVSLAVTGAGPFAALDVPVAGVGLVGSTFALSVVHSLSA